jgi:hypothetical protein
LPQAGFERQKTAPPYFAGWDRKFTAEETPPFISEGHTGKINFFPEFLNFCTGGWAVAS